MNGSESLLKQDVRGRVRTPAKRREALLDEFERSGVSGAQFAAMVGVKYQTFSAWACARRKKQALMPKARGAPVALGTAAPLRLVEAVVACEAKEQAVAVPASGMLQVHLGGGVRLEIGDAAQVKLAAALLKALGMEHSC
jgi:hypothetical protein